MEVHPGRQSAEICEARIVSWQHGWTWKRATKDRHLVAEYDDPYGPIGVLGRSETDVLQRPDEGERAARAGHGPFFRSGELPTWTQLSAPYGI